jgi:cyclopropane fatty-acyl-phospholipid synthase-like methyltransferase
MELDSYFYELFEGLPRQGPGDNESTRNALAMIQPLPNDVRILDIGCGSGTQTIELAGNTSGTITALDNHQPFLDELDRRVSREGLTERIKVVNGSMFSLDFAKESFDIIWSEGAIFIIGFEQGLEQFKPLLKPGGYMAVTDLCWIRDNPPAEIAAFFETVSPGMCNEAGYLAGIDRAGYKLIGSFTLPESSWRDEYYRPLEEEIGRMRKRYPGNPRVAELCEEMEREKDMYWKYSDYYGYVFFVMRKTG